MPTVFFLGHELKTVVPVNPSLFPKVVFESLPSLDFYPGLCSKINATWVNFSQKLNRRIVTSMSGSILNQRKAKLRVYFQRCGAETGLRGESIQPGFYVESSHLSTVDVAYILFFASVLLVLN